MEKSLPRSWRRRMSLQASSMGESVYRRLGYEELFAYRLLGAMPG